MTRLEDLGKAFERGKILYEKAMRGEETAVFREIMRVSSGAGESEWYNSAVLGDNFDYMKFLLKERNMAGKIQLIYGDPPFFSKGRYEASLKIKSQRLGESRIIKAGAYDDRWKGGLEGYLEMLTARLFMMRELLADRGGIWLHLDWHAVHYVKVIMDQIFGEENFINEVIWTYKSGGTGKRAFARKHDTLLFYSKGKDYKFNSLEEKSYNRDLKPYRFRGVEEFRDEKGWYTMVNMKDVWSVDMVGRTSSERTGYATQKPERLLELIISSCSDRGDICADFFGGSGTLGAVCEKSGRRWIMCDEGRLAFSDQVKRLGKSGACFSAAADERRLQKGRLKAALKGDEIYLREYQACTDQAALSDRKELDRFAEGDSLSLVKYWSVDPDFNGSVHSSVFFMSDGERSCSGVKGKGTINIKGQDVLGNFFSENVTQLK